MSDSIPRVFISYSHDSPDHKNRVLGLSERLRQDGLETSLDRYVRGTPRQKWHRWMLDQLDWADLVLVICTETYYRRFRGREELGKGKGADWEGALITQEIYDARSATTKFVPVIFELTHERFIPEPLRGHTFYLPVSEDGYQALYDFLLDQSGIEPGEIGVLKKKSRRRGTPLSFESPGQRPPLVSPARLRHGAERLFGREEELKRLDAAWDDPKTHILTLVAWGGVGKTSLVVEWMARKAADGWPGFERVFEWTFYSQGTREQGAVSAELFIAEALKFFGDPDPTQGSSWDRGERLARLVAERRPLLVLDGLEPLQHPPGSAQPGKLKDPALETLLKGLARHNPGLCLVTTRERVDDLKTWHTTTAPEWNLENLSPEAGAAVLHQAGAQRAGAAEIKPDDQELKDASEEVKGHALTLQLLGSYLARAHRGDIRKRTRVKFDKADERVQGGHAFRVMSAYEMWLGQSGAEGTRQLAVLRLLGLFDRPADPGCLGSLAPAIPGLTEPLAGLDEEEWNLVVSGLESAGLVETAPWEPKRVKGFSEERARKAMAARAKNRSFPLSEPEDFTPPQKFPAGGALALDAHPLLRQYFGKQLQEMEAKAWREGHRRLYQHLKESVPYWPASADGLQPLYQAVTHGCLAGMRQQACAEVYRARILRGREAYSVHKLGLIASDLGAVACFFEQPWSRPAPALTEAVQAWLLNQAAVCLRALGRLSEALEPMRAALELGVKQEDWENAARRASNLSELELTLGDVPGAARDGTQSVEYADRSGDAFVRLYSRTAHADALHQAGRPTEALVLFREAESMQAERQPKYPRLYSLQGFRYCDLLLAERECAAWRVMLTPSPLMGEGGGGGVTVCRDVEQRAAQTLKWYEQAAGASLLDIALDHLTLGRAALYRAILESSSFDTCHSSLDQAADGLHAAGTTHHLPRGLLTRAWLCFVEDDPTGARADLDEAWQIAERGAMKLFMADIHLHRARLFLDCAALAQARQLIEQCGYRRRKEELEDAERALGGQRC